MADDVDRGNETADKTLAGYINRVRARAARDHLEPTGECHNCAEPTPLVFCGPECRADFDHRENVRRRTGASSRA